MLIGQLNLAGRVVGGADKVAILIDLPDILSRVVIQDAAGGCSGERRRVGGHGIRVSGTCHIVHSEDRETVRSGRAHGLAVAGIGVIHLSISPLHGVYLL